MRGESCSRGLRSSSRARDPNFEKSRSSRDNAERLRPWDSARVPLPPDIMDGADHPTLPPRHSREERGARASR